MILENKNVYIRIEEKDIFFRDKTDIYNDTSGYTTKKRGIKKAGEYINYMFTTELAPELKFKHIREVLDSKFNLKVHTYCAMD